MRSLVFCFAVAGLLCTSLCQNLPSSVDEALAKVNEIIPGLSIPDLANNENLKKLNLTQLPISDAENVLRRKCEKNGGAGAYDAAKNAVFNFYNCTKDLVNYTVLQDEMEKAKPTGDLDEVFKKYCKKKPILKGCMTDFTKSLDPCLETIERENKLIVHNITDKILNFVCFKEGDRIALFIAAKGPECFQGKASAIGECMKSTYGQYFQNFTSFDPKNGLSDITNEIGKIKSIPSLVFDEKTCQDMNTLQGCVVNVLEGCEDPTPANLLDSIFNYIKKVTPCERMLGDQPQSSALTDRSSASTINIGLVAAIVAVFLATFS